MEIVSVTISVACAGMIIYYARLIWAGEAAYQQMMAMIRAAGEYGKIDAIAALDLLDDLRVEKLDNHTKAIFWRKDPRSLYSEECVRLLWPKATPRVSA